jgi:hypothetical protein
MKGVKMKYQQYPVVSSEEMIDKCIEAVTSETPVIRRMKDFIPLIYSVAVGQVVLNSVLKKMKGKTK